MSAGADEERPPGPVQRAHRSSSSGRHRHAAALNAAPAGRESAARGPNSLDRGTADDVGDGPPGCFTGPPWYRPIWTSSASWDACSAQAHGLTQGFLSMVREPRCPPPWRPADHGGHRQWPPRHRPARSRPCRTHLAAITVGSSWAWSNGPRGRGHAPRPTMLRRQSDGPGGGSCSYACASCRAVKSRALPVSVRRLGSLDTRRSDVSTV